MSLNPTTQQMDCYCQLCREDTRNIGELFDPQFDPNAKSQWTETLPWIWTMVIPPGPDKPAWKAEYGLASAYSDVQSCSFFMNFLSPTCSSAFGIISRFVQSVTITLRNYIIWTERCFLFLCSWSIKSGSGTKFAMRIWKLTEKVYAAIHDAKQQCGTNLQGRLGRFEPR